MPQVTVDVRKGKSIIFSQIRHPMTSLYCTCCTESSVSRQSRCPPLAAQWRPVLPAGSSWFTCNTRRESLPGIQGDNGKSHCQVFKELKEKVTARYTRYANRESLPVFLRFSRGESLPGIQCTQLSRRQSLLGIQGAQGESHCHLFKVLKRRVTVRNSRCSRSESLPGN